MKKKKKRAGPFSVNGILFIEGSQGEMRLKLQEPLNEAAVESALIVVEVLSGPFPLLEKEEALQTCYDSFSSGIEIRELSELGRRLVNMASTNCETLQ
jgi:hypothetical protein